MADSAPPAPDAAASPGLRPDYRLYVPQHDLVRVRVMEGVDREYCFQKAPGQDYYHLLIPGEIYVDTGDERLCLNCALRRELISFDRLFWQRRDL
jgi:hypothetical protein